MTDEPEECPFCGSTDIYRETDEAPDLSNRVVGIHGLFRCRACRRIIPEKPPGDDWPR